MKLEWGVMLTPCELFKTSLISMVVMLWELDQEYTSNYILVLFCVEA